MSKKWLYAIEAVFFHLIKSAQEEKDRAANLLEDVPVFARFRGEIVDNFAAWQKASIASSVTGELKSSFKIQGTNSQCKIYFRP